MIGARKLRQVDLARLAGGGKVKISVALYGHEDYEPTGRVNLFYVAGVRVAKQNTFDDDYPSEGVMATLLLAVGATVGLDNLPDAPSESEGAQPREELTR